MDQNYRLGLLPLDAADDDPRWKGYVEAERLGFVEGAADDAFVTANRTNARADGQRLRMVEQIERGIGPDQPVATLASWDGDLSVGHGRRLLTNLISDVTVRASHRRRGLLRELMTTDLAEAKQRGIAMAALTASEATIYGRFGFGVATRKIDVTIDTKRWALRSIPTGRCEYVDAETAEPHLRRLQAEREPGRGLVTQMAFLPEYLLGRFDWQSGEASKKVRLVLHQAVDGTVDGFASYEPQSSDEGSVYVNDVVATNPQAYLALWDFLAHIDLVDKVLTRLPWNTSLPWAITDSRVIKTRERTTDHLWLRILDVAGALAARGWDRDGRITLDVIDPMGLADGRFAVEIVDGVATVAPADADADIIVDVETLSSLYLGDVPVRTMADAGRLQGTCEAIAKMASLFTVDDAPWSPYGF